MRPFYIMSMYEFLLFTHLVGLALGVGASTVKLALVLQCVRRHEFSIVVVQVARPITRFIILGLVLLTLSGVGWLLWGFPLTSDLAIKLVFVVALWAVGPIIDRVVEPRFQKQVHARTGTSSTAFSQALRWYVAFEAIGTGLFYLITVLGMRI